MESELRQPELLSAERRPVRRCGLDEVGRGALAGPLVAAAVILPDDIHQRLGPLARFLRDSKTVPPARRSDIATALHQHALAVQIVSMSVETINQRGIGWCNREAFRLLIAAVVADEYIVDGIVRPQAGPHAAGRVRCLPRADALEPAVSAASLVAKVYRDDLMCQLHQQFPYFRWDSNAGYAAPVHLAALKTHGPCAEHRSVFVATTLSSGQKAKRARQSPPPAIGHVARLISCRLPEKGWPVDDEPALL